MIRILETLGGSLDPDQVPVLMSLEDFMTAEIGAGEPIFDEVPRTWRERLTTLPWCPWRATRKLRNFHKEVERDLAIERAAREREVMISGGVGGSTLFESRMQFANTQPDLRQLRASVTPAEFTASIFDQVMTSESPSPSRDYEPQPEHKHGG